MPYSIRKQFHFNIFFNVLGSLLVIENSFGFCFKEAGAYVNLMLFSAIFTKASITLSMFLLHPRLKIGFIRLKKALAYQRA
jgi:hypothetical protein